ncbi:NAD(P)/FAD-dependent oxidoreductase [Methanocella sp. CWC-04]|uniref:NAD(P)/FAD-dependent oxidoreductase n=1 Tax=Methanooceanicella nereidis TaxID=2052831 RepID=A0AAP2RGD8_9EURY|nr:NAD(P)/FAD-dependent oxidoreductase [Methanocella sp. CWC-04]MCD1295660.1 NAD(P)/FAD-dependent oxidoreductase [Methanocella sp. CWC-04]
MEYDVVVVGAGPVGSMAAKYAAKNGARTLLIEEHNAIGSPVSCTGHISTRALEECELAEGPFINKKIRGAFVYAPNNRSVVIDGRRTMTYVIERKIFDREMARSAASAGAEILLKTSARSVKKTREGTILYASGEGGDLEIKTKIVIGADGVKSKIAKYAGLGRVPHICSGVQVEASYEPRDPEYVEIFTGRKYVPNYFAWCVPTSGDCCRIGLLTDTDAHMYLNRLITEHGIVSKKARSSVDMIVGGVPVGTLKKTVTDGVMIVGDAAGHVKPVSYGGIFTGARCAKIAGEVAAKAAAEGNVGEQRLMEYEKRWKAEIGREFMFGMKFRDIYRRMSDDDINEAVAMLDDEEILETITRYGDIDRPSILARELFRMSGNKRLWQFMKLFARVIF